MPIKAAQDIGRQVKQQARQLARDTFETVKKTPGEMAGSALEQVGIPSGQSSASQQKRPSSQQAGQKTELQQLEEIDKAKSQQQVLHLKKELEGEIEKWRRLREEQIRRRREQVESTELPPEQAAVVQAPESKPKRGSLFLKRKKGKTEMAASKSSG